MSNRDNELVEDTDNGLEIANSNNELVEDTDNGLEIADANNEQIVEDADRNSDTIDAETSYTGTSEECNNVMFDYYKLGYVEMMYIEMNRQSIRIGEIGEKASEQVSNVVSELESLGSIVNVGVSDCASNLANKITERTQAIQSSMETQIKAHVELNNRLEKNLEYLDSLVDTLFDADGEQITWKSYLGEIESLSYQTKLNEYVEKKREKEEKRAEELRQQEDDDEEFVADATTDAKFSKNSSAARLTYYYPEDDCNSGVKTGSGFGINDFNIDENGWYTMTIENADGTTEEYVVLAGPTKYLFKSGYGEIDGKTYYQYGDIVNFTSNGVTYQGVILDSCGQAMREKSSLFDIFAVNEDSVNPTVGSACEECEKVGHVTWSRQEGSPQLGVLE